METKRRYSKQRECVLNALLHTKAHPNAATIYDIVKNDIPNISLGTVYRNLADLCRDGSIIKITAGDGAEHYDSCTKPHYHLLCKVCGSVSDIPLEYNSSLDREAENVSDAEIEFSNVVFYGTCKKCLKTKKQKNFWRKNL